MIDKKTRYPGGSMIHLRKLNKSLGAMLILFFNIVSTEVVAQAVLYVPQDYPTIQDAVDASSSFDFIMIAPGTYTGDGNRDVIVDGKNLTFISESPCDPTVIDIQGNQNAHHGFLTIRGYSWVWIRIVNLTIQGSYGINAVRSENANLFIESCDFTDNQSLYNGGAVFSTGSLVCSDSFFRGNTSSEAGGAVTALQAIILNCDFIENSCNQSGGAIWSSDNLVISESEFLGNAASDGGGVEANGSVLLTDCVFRCTAGQFNFT
jgi:predicted outer membrane repeat protein